jgi:hypothetical protein
MVTVHNNPEFLDAMNEGATRIYFATGITLTFDSPIVLRVRRTMCFKKRSKYQKRYRKERKS